MPKGFFRRAFCGGRFLRRTVLAAGRAVFAATGFRSPAPASDDSRRRFRTGRPPPGLRACRDACSGFDAPRSVHRGPCIGAMPAGSCVGRFASTLLHGAAPPPDFVRAGMRVPDSMPREVRASRSVHRRPCGAACVPRTGSEDRLSAASVRRRNAAERTFPFRCGEGSQYDTGDCGDAAHRTGGCPQRSDPVRRRGGAFRGRSDGAKEGPIAIGAVGVWGLPVVARCRPGEVCEQPDSRAVGQNGGRTAGQKGRRPDSFGKRKNADAARSCAGSEPVRRAGSANVGGGRRTSVSPIGKTERKRIWGRAAGAWS